MNLRSKGIRLSVITITSSNQVRISTNYRIADNGEEVDREIETKLYEGMKSLLGDTTYEEFSENMIQSRQKVGPTIADDIKVGAYWAVFFSLIAMALYILLRFRNNRVQCGYAGFGSLYHFLGSGACTRCFMEFCPSRWKSIRTLSLRY